jgi:hypothetical protein
MVPKAALSSTIIAPKLPARRPISSMTTGESPSASLRHMVTKAGRSSSISGKA